MKCFDRFEKKWVNIDIKFNNIIKGKCDVALDCLFNVYIQSMNFWVYTKRAVWISLPEALSVIITIMLNTTMQRTLAHFVLDVLYLSTSQIRHWKKNSVSFSCEKWAEKWNFDEERDIQKKWITRECVKSKSDWIFCYILSAAHCRAVAIDSCCCYVANERIFISIEQPLDSQLFELMWILWKCTQMSHCRPVNDISTIWNLYLHR